jgi:beta-N-acetylhexosaminidase
MACIALGIVGGQLFRAADEPPPALPAAVPTGAPPLIRATPASPPAGAPLARGSFLARLVPPPAEASTSARTSQAVEDLARRLPLERKVAQLMLVGFTGTDQSASVVADLRERDLGGVVVEARNYRQAGQLAGLTRALTSTARQASHLPPWILTAQEGGSYSQIPDLPPSRAPGRISSARSAGRSAAAAARSLKLLAVNGVLAPVIDVGAEGAPVAGTRVYSDDPDAVAQYAVATIDAYRRAGLLVAPKHFPGLGGATQPTETGPATVGLSVRELAQRDLRPFAAAVDAGTPAIVIGHGLYPFDDYALPASLSRRAATELLRRELRFTGVAITDDLASPALVGTSASVPDAAVDALRAGADMVWISGPRADQEAAYGEILNAVRKGKLERRRVDEALLRVLRAKGRLRLIPSPEAPPRG